MRARVTNEIDTSTPSPRISVQDRIALSLWITVLILCLAALSQTPVLYTSGILVLTWGGIHFFGRQSTTPLSKPIHKTKHDNNDAVLRAQTLLNEFPEAVWALGEKNELIYANAQALTLFPTVTPGRRINTLMRDLQIRDFIKDIFAGKHPAPIIYHTDSPVDRYLRISGTKVTPDPESGETKPHAIIVFHDVTDILKSASMRSDFLANASHELKTPIASLLGYIETLRGHAKDDPEAREKFLGIMQNQAERMQRLINDLLSLRQIEQSQHLRPNEDICLNTVVESAIDAVSPLAKTRDITIALNAPQELYVQGQKDALIQLCLNLIDNAVKLSPAKGDVTLTLGTVKSGHAHNMPAATIGERTAVHNWQILPPPDLGRDYGYIRIADTGPGLSQDHLPRLGERFYRIASNKHKGTGLGLAIVKHIVIAHRGGLHVGTTPREASAGPDKAHSGTCFTALLPLVSTK